VTKPSGVVGNRYIGQKSKTTRNRVPNGGNHMGWVTVIAWSPGLEGVGAAGMGPGLIRTTSGRGFASKPVPPLQTPPFQVGGEKGDKWIEVTGDGRRVRVLEVVGGEVGHRRDECRSRKGHSVYCRMTALLVSTGQ
jgi:hypothetical protein